MNNEIMESVLNAIRSINHSDNIGDSSQIYMVTQNSLQYAQKMKVINVDEWLFLTHLLDEVYNNWR